MEIYKKGNALIRSSTLDDVIYLGLFLRAQDREEIWASSHNNSFQALLSGLNISKPCLTLLYEKEPVCMFGVVPDTKNPKQAAIWLLGSDKIVEIQSSFLRLSRLFIPAFLTQYSILYNYIDVRNKVSRKWLEWCGASFEEPAPYGVEQMLFQKFTITKKEL